MNYFTARSIVTITAAFVLNAFDVHAQPITNPPPKYRAAVKNLDRWIAREVKLKDLPSLAIAMVDDQKVVWAKGFGTADAKTKMPATAETMYMVGSVSKPFTALLLMILVEMGLIDLDAPVSDYLPEFRPRNPHEKKITLRQMLSHRSGLVRESPVGNYFDHSEPSLAATVASLNKTALVYPPETKTSYSNAALATVGRVIEKMQNKPFAQLIKEKILDPMDMDGSSFAPSPAQKKKIASALMWTYHGREFPAPRFALGMQPAGSLHSNANDMAQFLKFIFSGGKGPKGRILKQKSLESMFKIQFPDPKEKNGAFGLGFFVSDFQGKKRISHGGAVYGYSTQFAALPDDKLGVIVMAARDVSNAVTRHIAEEALKSMLAVRAGKPLPKLVYTKDVPPKLARKLDGTYRNGKKSFELIESNGKLFFLPDWIGVKVNVRQGEDSLIVDGRLMHSAKLKPKGKDMLFDKKLYRRVATAKPKPAPKKWLGLIGEYGWDHNILYILEKNGKLYALIEWTFLYPLEEESANVFKFPDFGLYHGDKMVFQRKGLGRATGVNAANVLFPRRAIKGEDGKTFTVKATRSAAQLRRIALAAKPPKEKGKFRRPDMVDLSTLDKGFKFDIRYAGTNNFLQTTFYTSAKAFMQRPAGEALRRVHRKLAKKGYGLFVFDSYRPWHVTKMFWDGTPVKFHDFVADPSKGSRHNRGCAVDLTLYDLKTGKPVQMVAGFDEFSDRSYADYIGGTSLQRWHRDLLRRSMEEEGFSVYEAEWWHYDYRDWRSYPILNLTFEELEQKEK